MKSKKAILIITVLTIVINSAVLSQVTNQEWLKEDSVRFFVKKTEERAHGYINALWPTSDVMLKQKVQTSNIPEETMDKAINWMKVIVQKPYLPVEFKETS